jgi:hypothetical protein
MGESSAAYQSPVKDLHAINGRLNRPAPGASNPFRLSLAAGHSGFDPAAAPAGLVLQSLDSNSVRSLAALPSPLEKESSA